MELSSNLTGREHTLLAWAQEAMKAESDAVTAAAKKLGKAFCEAVTLLSQVNGKVVVTGLGKSGHVGRKIAATLASTGTPAFFLHPSEALHGDLGMLQIGDALLALAFGGETMEVIEVAKFARRLGVPVVSITGKSTSSLAALSNAVLDGSVQKEVCPLNLAPTASTAVALGLGDALAMVLMQTRGFSELDFATIHPGGSLGRRLAVVSDHMHRVGAEFGYIKGDTGFHEILRAVTSRNFGIVPVLGSDGELVGAISDGDIRRVLLKCGAEALAKTAEDFMTKSPTTVTEQLLAIDAFKMMEKKQITSLFVVDSSDKAKLLGIVRMHDLLAAKIV